MEKVIGKFDVKWLQVLDEKGNVDQKLMPKLNPVLIKQMYEWMVLTRVFDDKALKLQRQGRLGTYAPVRGQEACQIGSALAMQKDDFVFPAFREEGTFFVRGMPPEMLFQFWAGDERGMQIPKNVNMFPIAITVGSHMPHAVGAAMAFKLLKKKGVVINYFGDGATSEGDFHEAMNFAGVYNAPIVFICQNNQWAISLPVSQQTASSTLAQKAIAYGFQGIKIDGNDVFAVYKVTKEAVDNARAGNGTTLIENVTYRMGDHSTSDDAKKYRSDKEVQEWAKKDPILRLEKYMRSKKLLDDRYKQEVAKKAKEKVEKEVEIYENLQDPNPEDMFKYVYEEWTDNLKEQIEELKSNK